jgi:hypothetical protein
MTSEQQEQLLGIFSAEAKEAERLCFIVRASELQAERVDRLADFLVWLWQTKEELIKGHDEDGANLILALEYMTSGLKAELQMWIELKDGSPEKAWELLVRCQMLTQAAIRSHALGQNAGSRLRRYESLEEILFPQQLFSSVGAISKYRMCSICKGSYDECPHIIGRPYWGRMCGVTIEEVEKLEDIAVVKNPEDKRCRVVAYSDQDGRRDLMTWRLDQSKATDIFCIEGMAVRYDDDATN